MNTSKPRTKGSLFKRIALIGLGAVIGIVMITAVGFYWKLNSITRDTVAIVTRPISSSNQSGMSGISSGIVSPSNSGDPLGSPGLSGTQIATGAPGAAGPGSPTAQPSVTSPSLPPSAGSSQLAQPPTPTPLPEITGTPADIDVDYDVTVDHPKQAPIYQTQPTDANVFNVVLLSSDARPGETVGRSDSMILLSYNRKTATIRMVSIMRDIWVPIEGYGWNRINAAYAFGGVGLAVNTLNDNLGLDVQNYATIRFEQFISIVDQLGGVPISLTRAEIDYINRFYNGANLDPTPGIKQLNGAQTLLHCRNRSVGNGDFDRTRRQRYTMLAILQKMKQQRNPVTLARLISNVLDQINTNMKANDILVLATEALNARSLRLEEASIPFDKTWHYANENGRSVIAVDLARNRDLLKRFLY